MEALFLLPALYLSEGWALSYFRISQETLEYLFTDITLQTGDQLSVVHLDTTLSKASLQKHYTTNLQDVSSLVTYILYL